MFRKRLLGGAQRLKRDKNGNVAMITGIVLLPIVAIMGFAVDLSITGNNREMTAEALDSAILSAARARLQGLSDQQVADQFQTYFSALTSDDVGRVTCSTPVLYEDGIDMLARTTCTSQSMVAGATGARYVTFDLESRVTFGIGKLDIAFVFDVSGSMDWSSDYSDPNAPSRLEALKTAATAGVTNLLNFNTGDTDDIRIAAVGYSRAVYAGDYFEYATGLTPTRTYYSDDGGAFGVQEAGTPLTHITLGLYDSRTNTLIGEIRDQAEIRVTEEQADHLAIAALVRSDSEHYGDVQSVRFNFNRGAHKQTENSSPYSVFGDNNGNFASGDLYLNEWNRLRTVLRDKPNNKGTRLDRTTIDFYIELSEVSERTITNYCTYERNSGEWDQATKPRTGHYISGGHATYDDDDESWTNPRTCNDSAPPRALDTDADAIGTYIQGMDADGGTAGHLGIAWGRYLLSPDWADAYETEHSPLAWDEPDSSKILILMTDGEFNTTYHGNLGTSFSQAQAQCDDAKNNDSVLIYTIAFNAPQAGQDVLNYCASGSDFRFDANNGQELLDAYTAIAASISDLRLVSTAAGEGVEAGYPIGGGGETHNTSEIDPIKD